MNENFQPAGMLGDQGDSDLEYIDFGDNVGPQKQRAADDFPQYVPKHTGGFGLPEKKKINGNVKDYSHGGRVSKARQRKKRDNSLPTDAMAVDNFRVACSRGNLEEVKAHLVNGKCCVMCMSVCACVWWLLSVRVWVGVCVYVRASMRVVLLRKSHDVYASIVPVPNDDHLLPPDTTVEGNN